MPHRTAHQESSASPFSKKRLGQWGEDVACVYLTRKGYTVLHRNWRVHQQGEVDIIATCGETLVFIEVKTRHSSQEATGLEALTPTKKRRLTTVIAAYLQQLAHPDTPCTIDWLLVTPTSDGGARIQHTQNLELFD
jgi:putative endonuclease